MREIWEVAEALEGQGLATRITRHSGGLKLKVYRDGIRIGALWFPLER